MKMTFDEYMLETIGRPISTFLLSDNIVNHLKQAYSMGIGIKSFFDMNYSRGDDFCISYLNDKLRRAYKIQFHNVGKNPYKRYFEYEDHYSWLKLEQFLISHFYAIQKDETYISNKTIAIKLGWLSETEKNEIIIHGAEKKVLDNLFKLKNDRKTISVTQHHNPGKRGSYHRIVANWFVIIPLYSEYKLKDNQTIRMRKSIKYRIISLVNKLVTTFTEGFKKLLNQQQVKYLKGLISLDHATFKLEKDIWKEFVDEYHLPEWYKDPSKVLPKVYHSHVLLEVKNEFTLNHLTVLSVRTKFQEYYNRPLTIRVL